MSFASDSLRVGLGCMRLSTDADREPARAEATLAAALDAGITLFDTAHAYGLDERELGHNERLLAAFLEARGAVHRTRVITKGGMTRPRGHWLPDGRASALREDCEASLKALGKVPIALYLVHAPDRRVPWATTVRALRALKDEGLVREVGLSNVNLQQLDEALELAPVVAVQQAFSLLDDAALRSGVVARCLERGLTLLAHSPLGGVKKAAGLLRAPALRVIADRHRASPAQVALAALLDLHPNVVVLPGARRPETARDCAAAATLKLTPADFVTLKERFTPSAVAAPAPAPASATREVVLLMGLQGAGKSRAVARWLREGDLRLNRDTEGGTLKQLAGKLDRALASGTGRVVLDNTLLTRESRRLFLDVAAQHQAKAVGVWHEISSADAQVNVTLRMLLHHGRLLEPAELAKGKGPESLSPRAFFAALRSVEPPTAEEGFTSLETVPFVRQPLPGTTAARFVSLDAALAEPALLGGPLPTLVFGWREAARPETLAALKEQLGAGVELAVCSHPSGPPSCWCRPPQPGLVLAFAIGRRVELAGSTLVPASAADRAMAAALGCRVG